MLRWQAGDSRRQRTPDSPLDPNVWRSQETPNSVGLQAPTAAFDSLIEGSRKRLDTSTNTCANLKIRNPIHESVHSFVHLFILSFLELPPRARNCAVAHSSFRPPARKINSPDKSKRGRNLLTWKSLQASWGVRAAPELLQIPRRFCAAGEVQTWRGQLAAHPLPLCASLPFTVQRDASADPSAPRGWAKTGTRGCPENF